MFGIFVLNSKQRNKSLVEEVFSNHYNELKNTSLYILTSDELSKDVVSSAFIEVLEGIEKEKHYFASYKMCKSFIFNTVKNRSIDVLRKMGRTPVMIDINDYSAAYGMTKVAGCNLRLEEDDLSLIFETVKRIVRLTDLQMKVLDLLKQDSTNIEISQKLGISRDRTNKEIYKVRRELKDVGFLQTLK